MNQTIQSQYIDYLEQMLGSDFLHEIGFYRLEPTKQEKNITQIVSILGTRIGQTVLTSLSDTEEKSKLESMLADEKPLTEILDYINEYLPGLGEHVQMICEEFKKELRQELALS